MTKLNFSQAKEYKRLLLYWHSQGKCGLEQKIESICKEIDIMTGKPEKKKIPVKRGRTALEVNEAQAEMLTPQYYMDEIFKAMALPPDFLTLRHDNSEEDKD